MALSRELEEKRWTLFYFWHLGYCVARGDEEAPLDEPSELAHVMSCAFFHAEHPHLRFNRQEIGLVECFAQEKMMPPKLLKEIKAKLPSTARESGVSADLLLAACYGYVMVKAADEAAQLDGAEVVREVMKAVHAEIEKSVK